MKNYKKRDWNIVAMAKGFYKPKVVKNKKIYSRKEKHKKKYGIDL
jgi:hypothetical protein